MSQDWVFNNRVGLLLTVYQPRTKAGLKLSKCWLTPRLLQLLLQLQQDGDLSVLEPQEVLQLQELGLLVRPQDLPELVWFRPELSEHWPALLPPYQCQTNVQDPDLLVSRLELAGSADPAWPEALLGPDSQTVWLPPLHPQQLRLPFCPSPALQMVLADLRRGARPADLPAMTRDVLVMAGALKRAAETPPRTDLAEARQSLHRCGYAVLESVVNPLHLAALREYIRELARCGYFQPDQNQVADRLLIHHHLLLQYIQQQLCPWVAGIVTQAIKPSYSILAIYPGGSELLPHFDRDQCLWNVSLVLAYEPGDSEPWPFCLESGGQVHQVPLEMGSLLIYSGSQTRHWRPRLPEGRYAAIGLFHFVAADFTGSLD